MNKRKIFRNQKILHYSNEPTSNYKAIHKIAFELNLPPVKVKQYIDAFFGKFGIKYFVKLGIEMNIYGFGKFYFHKKVFNEKLKHKFKKMHVYRDMIKKYKLKLK